MRTKLAKWTSSLCDIADRQIFEQKWRRNRMRNVFNQVKGNKALKCVRMTAIRNAMEKFLYRFMPIYKIPVKTSNENGIFSRMNKSIHLYNAIYNIHIE